MGEATPPTSASSLSAPLPLLRTGSREGVRVAERGGGRAGRRKRGREGKRERGSFLNKEVRAVRLHVCTCTIHACGCCTDQVC